MHELAFAVSRENQTALVAAEQEGFDMVDGFYTAIEARQTDAGVDVSSTQLLMLPLLDTPGVKIECDDIADLLSNDNENNGLLGVLGMDHQANATLTYKQSNAASTSVAASTSASASTSAATSMSAASQQPAARKRIRLPSPSQSESSSSSSGDNTDSEDDEPSRKRPIEELLAMTFTGPDHPKVS